MQNHKVYLGKITDPLPLKEMETDMLRNERAAPLQVNFNNGQRALLDLSQPRAAGWARIMDLMRKQDRPVYVEKDADSDMITGLCIPVVTKVLEIYAADEDVVLVGFTASDAVHYLHRDLADFKKLYDLLQDAKATGSEIMAIATLHDFDIIDVQALASSLRNEEPDEPLPPLPPIVPVSPEKAIELFNIVNAVTCRPWPSESPCIPFKHPSSGCNVRAHLMCFMIDDAGVIPEKIWISGKLRARSLNVPKCIVGWFWHVAATLMVTQPDGPPVRMVIDPSLSDRPITEAHWRSLMSDPPNGLVTINDWRLYNFRATGLATRAEADEEMEIYRELLDDQWKKDPPPYRCPPLEIPDAHEQLR